MRLLLYLYLVSTLVPPTSPQSTCGTVMPYQNMQYLTSPQLTQYGLTDPCSVVCAPGYFGDFCTPIPTIPTTPQGPWNLAGYYTSGPGVFKTMTLSLSSSLTQVSYTSSESTLVALYNQQLYGSALVLISLVNRRQKTILSAPAGGYLDALQVRYGRIFVARTMTNQGPYDIAEVTGALETGPYGFTTYTTIPVRASFIEIFQDKGMNTTFIYSIDTPAQNQLKACYPGTGCVTWAMIVGVTGMVCGMDCPNAIYVASKTNVLKVTSTDTTTLVSSSTVINCMSSVPELNTVLFRTSTFVQQLSAASSVAQNILYPSVLTLDTPATPCTACCSLDVSDSASQIMLIEGGKINTIEAVQIPCMYETTSPSIVSNDPTDCTACPEPPDNAYIIPSSQTCQWRCMQGFTSLGSQCVALDSGYPCQRYFVYRDGVCIPSTFPWAQVGRYVDYQNGGLKQGVTFTISPSVGNLYPPYITAAGGGVSFLAMSQNLYASVRDSNVWQLLSPSLLTTPSPICGYSTNNYYSYLTQQGGYLWVGFSLFNISPRQYCVWALNVGQLISGAVSGTGWNPATQFKPALAQFWVPAGKVCSVAGEQSGGVYFLLCNTGYILKSSMASNALSLLAGQIRSGYADGPLLKSLFNAPTSLLAYGGRVYVTDTGNCLIREIDPVRGIVSTVAGAAGVCERQDGIGSGLGSGKTGLMHPRNFTPTPYDGFFLFLDQGTGESYPTIRQFHAGTGAVRTIKKLNNQNINSLLSFTDRLSVVYNDNALFTLSLQTLPCPEGSVSREGGAFSASDCITCTNGFYASGDTCQPCTQVTCTDVGRRPVQCKGNSDSYCGYCSNKPAGTSSAYTGPATVYDGWTDCPWVYTPPCPVGYYKSGAQCLLCPPWSTTISTGATGISQCKCISGSMDANFTCIVPSSYTALPPRCNPLTQCQAASVPSFPFPIIETCSSSFIDSPDGVCLCQPGEYIAQIYPKVCALCPAYLYSPNGQNCLVCPPYAEPSLDGTACRCISGTKDTALTARNPTCVCDAGMGFSAQRGCYQCVENTYNSASLLLTSTPWLQTKFCVPCAPGTYAGTGQSACTACPAGKYRESGMAACSECSKGKYATDPTRGSSCTSCQTQCQGLKQSQCPTDPSLYVCSACPPVRANAVYNGADDCASSCRSGYYEDFERNGDCVRCTTFNSVTCPAGNVLVPCGKYNDASCAPCANKSKPVYFSEWYQDNLELGVASKGCSWRCVDGYVEQRSPGADQDNGVWMCVKIRGFSVFDLFTI